MFVATEADIVEQLIETEADIFKQDMGSFVALIVATE